MKEKLAVTSTNIGEPVTGIGNLGLEPGTDTGVSTLTSLISTLIGLLTVIAALYFMFMLVTGAIGIISSGGDKGAYEDARKKITFGVIGLVVVISAIFIMRLVATFLGIPNILNLGEMIDAIRL
jgi:uncharacterized membrane protein YphA (DoxX/SURF4 family)